MFNSMAKAPKRKTSVLLSMKIILFALNQKNRSTDWNCVEKILPSKLQVQRCELFWLLGLNSDCLHICFMIHSTEQKRFWQVGDPR